MNIDYMPDQQNFASAASVVCNNQNYIGNVLHCGASHGHYYSIYLVYNSQQ